MNIKQLGISLLAILCLTFGARAMEAPEGVAEATLKEVLASCQLPQEEAGIINKWAHSNVDLLKELSRLGEHEYNKSKPFKAFGNDASSSVQRDVLAKLKSNFNIENKSFSNYVFHLPGAEERFIVKIPGQINRWWNLVEFYALEVLKKPRGKLTQEDVDKIAAYFKENPSRAITYQGISRALFRKRLQGLLDREILNKDLVIVPDVYLVAYPGTTHNTPINDDTYFPVERVIEGKVLTEELVTTLSPDTIVELLKAAHYGYMWNLGWPLYSNFMVGDDNKLYILDLEQPNRWYYGPDIENNKNVCQLYAVNGMESVIKMAKNNPDQYEAVKAYIKKLDLNYFVESARNHLNSKPDFKEILS